MPINPESHNISGGPLAIEQNLVETSARLMGVDTRKDFNLSGLDIVNHINIRLVNIVNTLSTGDPKVDAATFINRKKFEPAVQAYIDEQKKFFTKYGNKLEQSEAAFFVHPDAAEALLKGIYDNVYTSANAEQRKKVYQQIDAKVKELQGKLEDLDLGSRSGDWKNRPKATTQAAIG